MFCTQWSHPYQYCRQRLPSSETVRCSALTIRHKRFRTADDKFRRLYECDSLVHSDREPMPVDLVMAVARASEYDFTDKNARIERCKALGIDYERAVAFGAVVQSFNKTLKMK